MDAGHPVGIDAKGEARQRGVAMCLALMDLLQCEGIVVLACHAEQVDVLCHLPDGTAEQVAPVLADVAGDLAARVASWPPAGPQRYDS